MQYPKIIITEVLQPTNSLKNLARLAQIQLTPFYEMNECRNIVMKYISVHSLDKESDAEGAPALKGGQIRIDPNLFEILAPKPPPMTETVRKDAIFKSLSSCTNAAYVISPVDPNQALNAQEASSFTLHQASSSFHAGKVPTVKVEAFKYRNRKVTRTCGLELYQVDLQEFARHLRNKCQSAVTINELPPASSKQGGGIPVKGPLREVVIQGKMIKEIEESLCSRYKIPLKYIESVNKLPEKKKKK